MRRADRGVAIVEAAIMLPLFFLVLMGTIEFGLVFHNYLVLQNATREGARFGAIGSSESSVEERVREFAANLDQERLTVEVTNAQGGRGTTLTVAAAYPVPLITPLIERVLGGNSFDLHTEASMRLE